MKLGELLLDLREEKGFLQKELAVYLNVSIGTISNYENNVHSPDLQTLCKLADFFNVSTDYLLRRTILKDNLEKLNKKVGIDYTVANLVNTSIELTSESFISAMDYIEYLHKRDCKH